MTALLGKAAECRSRLRPRWGFTLVEVLIVVTILAILAAAVIPTFIDSSGDARDSALMYDLQAVRHQIQLFRAQHKGNWPGFNGAPALVHMMLTSNEDGGLSASPSPSFPYGPYLPIQGAVNPFNGGKSWKASSDPPGEIPNESMTDSGGAIGWFYDKATGRISANAEGSTSNGTPRVQL